MTVATTTLDALRADYRRDGVAVLRGALSPEIVDSLRRSTREAWDRAERDPAEVHRLYLRRHRSGARVADRVDPCFDLDPWLAALPSSPLLTEPAAALVGEPLWVLKDKLILKAPGVDGYGPHQDFAYYAPVGVPADHMVAVLIPVEPVDAAAGPVEVAHGTHDRLVATDEVTRDPLPAAIEGLAWTAIDAGPGDIAFLHPLALHRSAPNRSTRGRSTAFVTFGSGPDGDAASERLAAAYRDRLKGLIDAGGTDPVTVPPTR